MTRWQTLNIGTLLVTYLIFNQTYRTCFLSLIHTATIALFTFVCGLITVEQGQNKLYSIVHTTWVFSCQTCTGMLCMWILSDLYWHVMNVNTVRLVLACCVCEYCQALSVQYVDGILSRSTWKGNFLILVVLCG